MGIRAVGILYLVTALPELRQEAVSKDRRQPGAEVRAWLEAVNSGDGAEHRFLHQVIRLVGAATDGHGEGAQVGRQRKHLLLDGQRSRLLSIFRAVVSVD